MKFRYIYMRFFTLITSIIFFIYGLLLILGVMGNPFSFYAIEGAYKQIDEKELLSNIDLTFHGDRRNNESKGISERYYIYNNEKVRIIFGKRPARIPRNSKVPFEPIRDCQNDEFHIVDIVDQKKESCALKTDVQDPNVHPLLPFSKSVIGEETHYHILGTIANDNLSKGVDRLTHLSSSIYESTKLSAYSLLVFIFFGLYFAIMIGYYRQRFTFINSLNNFLLKTFESVPIILWTLIIIIIFDYNDSLSSNSKIAIYFSFFGLFSSPALANLIIEKINQMKNEDFIVALKLLGLKDRRIIFTHMLRYYCMPIIFFQMAYIMVHAFFLDITLSFIEKNSPEISTFGSYMINSSRNNIFYGNDFNFLIIPSFIIAFVFYKIAATAKSKL